jgi:outer membrane protein assembly factor BamB
MSPRRRLAPALAAALGLLAAAADWPQLLGPERNGVSAETGLLRAWPPKGPPVLWEKAVGPGLSGPVVAGPRLILFHRRGDREIVECFDAATGAERWQFGYPTAYTNDLGTPHDEGPRSTPLIADGRVWTLGAEGRLHCLDLESGKKLWDRDVNGDYGVSKAYFGVGTSPLLEGNRLLVNVGGHPGAGIVAFDKDTGKEVWKATNHDASYSSPVAATIGGTRYVLFLTREGLVGLDPASGAVRFSKRWRARFDASVNAAVPLVVGDEVFLSASYNTGAVLVKVRPDGLDEIWKADAVLSNHYNTSVYHDGYLYGLDGRQEQGARLRCVELRTGAVRWTQEGFGCSSLILAEGNLICLTENGELVLVEATSAAYREKARAVVLGKPCRAHPALADGRLFGRDGKRLVCWNLKR